MQTIPPAAIQPGGQPAWSAVDAYLESLFAPDDLILTAALENSQSAGLPAMAVSPMQGKWLYGMARAIGARRILELGTLGGYSTIWLARALPTDGQIVTLELEPKHAAVARANLDQAGLGQRVEVRVGPAVDLLAVLIAERAAGAVLPFDFIFVDADKENYPAYFTAVMQLIRPGGLIALDNVIRQGAVIDAANTDPRVIGVRETFARIAAEPRASASVIQTVGGKGYDGMALIVVEG